MNTDRNKNGSIKLAVPSAAPGGLEADRSGHFGRCECFTVVDCADRSIKNVAVVTNLPHSEGGCLAPVNLLQSHGVNAIAVSGIGMRPLMGFQSAGIEVLIGTGDKVQDTVDAYLKFELDPISEEDTCGGH